MTAEHGMALADGGRINLVADGAWAERNDAYGLLLWRLQPADAQDAFVALDLVDGNVILTSWQGVAYRVRATDGAVVATTFVK